MEKEREREREKEKVRERLRMIKKIKKVKYITIINNTYYRCLKSLWRDGLLIGFIGKDEVQKLLSPCKPNTFILRYRFVKWGFT